MQVSTAWLGTTWAYCVTSQGVCQLCWSLARPGPLTCVHPIPVSLGLWYLGLPGARSGPHSVLEEGRRRGWGTPFPNKNSLCA